MSHILHTRKFYFATLIIAGSVFASLAGIFLFSFLHVFTMNSAHADTATTSTEVATELEPTITIWTTNTSNEASDSVSITANPDKSVATATTRVHVSTNNPTGYTLTIKSNSDAAAMSRSDSDATIDPLTGNGTSATSWASNNNLNDMWGYSVGSNDSYRGVPNATATAATIDSTSGPSNGNYTDVTFGAKVDADIPAGTYTDTVVFSAVANYVAPTYFQDMSVADCAALDAYDPENSDATTYAFKDKRDKQTYKVRRLYMSLNKMSSSCWIVENLKLTADSIKNAGNSPTLTSADTNLETPFTITSSDDSAWCTTNSEECINQPMLVSAGGDYGVFYNWFTGTAGTGTQGLGSDETATASICPGKGTNAATTWHLPSAGRATSNREWYQLFFTYRSAYEWSTVDGSGNTVTTNNLSTTIGPNFVYSGNRIGGNNANQDVSGTWLSRTAESDQYVYLPYVGGNGSVFGGTSRSSKFYGYPIRCVLPAA